MLSLNFTLLDRLRALSGFASEGPAHAAAPASPRAAKSTAPAADHALPAAPLEPLASTAERRTVDALVQTLARENSRALVVAIVDRSSGLPLSATGAPYQLSPASFAVQIGRTLRRATEMVAAIAPEAGLVEEFIFSSTDHLHLLRPVAAGRWYVYLLLNPQDTNMAIARTQLQNAADAVEFALAASAA